MWCIDIPNRITIYIVNDDFLRYVNCVNVKIVLKKLLRNSHYQFTEIFYSSVVQL